MNCPEYLRSINRPDLINSHGGCDWDQATSYIGQYGAYGVYACPQRYGWGSVPDANCGAGCRKPWSSSCADY